MKKILFALFLSACVCFGVQAQSDPEAGYVHFSEDFENMTYTGNSYFYNLPDGWSTIADNNNNSSNYTGWGKSWTGLNFTEGNKVAGSTSYLASSANTCDRWLITPRLDVPYNSLKLTFSLYGNDNSYPESVKVYISTTGKEKADFTATTPVLNVQRVPAGWNQYMIDLDNYVGDSIYIAFLNCGRDGYYTCVDNVTISIVAPSEISLDQIKVPSITRGGDPMNISGTVTNHGANNLTSFQVTYTANGQTSSTYTVTGINVPYGSSYFFTHNEPFTPAIGNNTISVTVSMPNNVEDNPADNTLSGSFEAYDPAGTIVRNVLMENFTTAQCPNCPGAHDRIHNALQGIDNVIWVAHHVGYYTDNMTINESNQLLPFYNDGGGTYAPALMLDRTLFDAPQWDDCPGPVFFPSNDVGEAIDLARTMPSFVELTFSELTYDESTRQVTAKIAGNFLTDRNLASPRLSCYIIEDNIMGQQSGASGQFQHNNVIRASVSNVLGDANIITSTTSGSTFEHTYTYTLPASWKYNYCRVVAFVSNYNSSNVNDCQVENSIVSNYLVPGVGINEASADANILVYPNPASEKLVVETNSDIQEISILNTLGQVVYKNNHVDGNQTIIDLASFNTGLYIVNIRDNNGSSSRRINVVK